MKMIDTETARQERERVAHEIRDLEKQYLILTRQAFPEGSEHICSRGGGMVKVEIVRVCQPHRIMVRSETGKKYVVDPYYLQ